MALAIATVNYFVLNKLIPGKLVDAPIVFEKSGDAVADRVLDQGAHYLHRLEELSQVIDSEKLRNQIAHLTRVSTDIFNFIKKNPAHARKITTFMDYYYPTALKFLENYVDLDKKVVKGDNISATMEKISAGLTKIEEAFEHQLDSLFSDKALDITTDIAVLDNIMEQEGL